MPRAKRTVIDDSSEANFPNTGVIWDERFTYQSYTADPVAPQDDRTTVTVPTVYRGDGTSTDTLTIWGRGLISFGVATGAQIAYMATLASFPAGGDLRTFLAGFPGDYIDAGFRRDGYGDMEAGLGEHDYVANPFGAFADPFGDPPTAPTIFDRDQAHAYGYIAFAGPAYEGTRDDWADVFPNPILLSAANRIDVSEEGFGFGDAGGNARLNGTAFTAAGGGFVYYSDLNVVQLGDGADVAAVTGGPEALLGGGGDDRLTGGALADRLDGGRGDDVLVGGGGIDRLFGGDGNDDLSDGDERGTLVGGDGDDVLRPGGGEDNVDGGDGVDRLVVDYSGRRGDIAFAFDPATADYLFPDAYKRVTGVEAITFGGGGGRDTLAGADGDDVLRGNRGSDTLRGNAGNDRLFGGDARDWLEGGDGDDLLDGGTGNGPTQIDSAGSPRYDLNGDPDLSLHVEQQDSGFIGGTQTYGWTPAFSFTVSDPLTQRLSIDLSLIEGNGAFSAGYSVTLYRIEDDGRFTELSSNFDAGGYATAFAFDRAGRYALYISSLDDDAAALTVAVRLSGVAAFHGDTLIGGLGDDTYLVDSRDDRVIEAAGEGDDTIVTGLSTFSLAALPAVERLTGDGGAQRLTGNALANVIVGGGGADTLIGAGGADRLIVGATPARVVGGRGYDQLIVAAGASVTLTPALVSGIEAYAVQNRGLLDLSRFADGVGPLQSLSEATKRATIVGTAGDDRILGGDGADRLFGGAGDDTITLHRQAGVVDGGSGTDALLLQHAAGQRFAFSGAQLAGIERITVGGGVRLDLTGLTVAPGEIFIDGGRATVIGSDVADRIHGGSGADVIAGGLGQDVLTGGGGADRFLVTVAEGSAARDQLADFDHAEGDRIDLSLLSDRSFRFIGTAAFSGAAATGPEIRATINANGIFLVQIDLDHDARADALLLVYADAPLTAGDFVF